jgi:tetratricopeptide (TPR) repeat protein
MLEGELQYVDEYKCLVYPPFIVIIWGFGCFKSYTIKRVESQVLELEPENLKALYRRLQAYVQIGELELAHADIAKALRIDPENKCVKHFLEIESVLCGKRKLPSVLSSVFCFLFFGGCFRFLLCFFASVSGT